MAEVLANLPADVHLSNSGSLTACRNTKTKTKQKRNQNKNETKTKPKQKRNETKLKRKQNENETKTKTTPKTKHLNSIRTVRPPRASQFQSNSNAINGMSLILFEIKLEPVRTDQALNIRVPENFKSK